jgi:hypothetical protein
LYYKNKYLPKKELPYLQKELPYLQKELPYLQKELPYLQNELPIEDIEEKTFDLSRNDITNNSEL